MDYGQRTTTDRTLPCLRMSRAPAGCRLRLSVPDTRNAAAVDSTSPQSHRKCERSRTMFVLNDAAFQEMIAKGKAQGTLTYEEVSSFLPDEIEGTERIDTLLAALDGLGIELVDGPDAHRRDLAEQDTTASDGDRFHLLNDGLPAGSSDP